MEKILSSGENKEQLIEFIYHSWKADPMVLKGIEVFCSAPGRMSNYFHQTTC
jgi:hypothetical protein